MNKEFYIEIDAIEYDRYINNFGSVVFSKEEEDRISVFVKFRKTKYSDVLVVPTGWHKYFTIYKTQDEWYLIYCYDEDQEKDNIEKCYLCDQFDGLIKFIKDNPNG